MKALNIFFIELKQLLANIKTQILIFIIMPFLIAAVNGFIFDKMFDPSASLPKFNVAFIDLDKGKLSSPLKDLLTSDKCKDIITLKEEPALDTVKEALYKGNFSAAIIVPKNFSADITSGKEVSIEVLKAPSAGISGDITSDIVNSYTQSLNINSGIYSALMKNVQDTSLVNRVYSDSLPIISNTIYKNRITEGTFEKAKKINSKQFFSIAMLVLFSLNLASYGASIIVKEKQNKILLRLKSTTLSKSSYLIGKLLSVFIIAILQGTSFILLTHLALKLYWGSNIFLILLLVLAQAIAVVGLSAFGAAMFKTEAAIRGIYTFVIMAMSFLGGAFMPIEIWPHAMQTVSHFTLNYWLQNGYTNTMLDSSLTSININLLITFGVGILGILFGIFKFKFEE